MTRLSTMCGALALAIAGLAAAPSALAETSYSFASETGDYIGQGQSRTYTGADANIAVSGNAQALQMSVSRGSDNWRIELSAPRGQRLQPGRYYFAERSAFRTGRSPGIDIDGNGRGCGNAWGSVYIQQIEFGADDAVTALEATGLQRCERENAPLLTAKLRYNAPPLSLALDSDAGDYIGRGLRKDYAGDTSTFAVSGNDGYLIYSVSGQRDSWSAILRPPTGQTLGVGTYPISRFGDANSFGFDFAGNGRGCNRVAGSIAIKAVEVDPLTRLVTGLSADFEQRCEAGSTALRGSLRYKR
ncbi:hypothetical protein SAMN04487939_101617 [Lysobacter sp. yr284]|uniref:hypothetical protein n=1 Tax=Lysobacter sp. yr284 TaxID=1761791 RepID=UPI0008992699|nr:hypothetical protein [Lysobacter sp. yr284]SDY28133.1 hypothetical protein SAMN04487939_101617 [Lysobacter sp. yr284]